jgi:K+-transporting ATPase ATPase C chain
MRHEDMKAQLRSALLVFLSLTVVTGVAYPALVTLIAQAVFPRQANGSIIERDGKKVGSALIGQPFDDPRYFWGRPSATAPFPYNAAASAGSNLGPTNPILVGGEDPEKEPGLVRERVKALRDADPGNDRPIPVDLVTASASGLDPHISPAAAEYQVERVARARGLDADTVRQLTAKHTQGRTLGVLGEPRVNVLALNLALDAVGGARK